MAEGADESRVFLDWRRPVAPACADWLLASELRDGCSLAHCLVVVPTANAGRILRDALLARRLDMGASGLLQPTIQTPQQALAALAAKTAARPLASPEQCELLWIATLAGFETTDLRGLLPAADGTPARLDFSARRGIARRLARLRRALAEAACDIAAVAGSSELLPPSESERWADLARLEMAYRRRLSKAGLSDPEDAMRAAAGQEVLSPETTSTLVLASVPDPNRCCCASRGASPLAAAGCGCWCMRRSRMRTHSTRSGCR